MPTSKCTRQNHDSYINVNLLKKKSWNLQPTNLTTSFTQQKNHEDLFWRASFFPSIIFLSMWQFMLAFFVMEAVLRIRPAHLWRRLKVLGSVTCYLTLKKHPQLSSNMWVETIWSLPFFKGIPATTQNTFFPGAWNALHRFSGRVFGPTEVCREQFHVGMLISMIG